MAEFKLLQEKISNKPSGQEESVLGPLLFIIHIKDLPPTVEPCQNPQHSLITLEKQFLVQNADFSILPNRVLYHMSMWEPPTFIQVEVRLLGNSPITRYPRKQIGKHTLEGMQTRVGPPLLSSQRFGKNAFVITNNLHGYA
jgi:hypothetical protein